MRQGDDINFVSAQVLLCEMVLPCERNICVGL
jgi:hypothetical protein